LVESVDLVMFSRDQQNELPVSQRVLKVSVQSTHNRSTDPCISSKKVHLRKGKEAEAETTTSVKAPVQSVQVLSQV